MSPRLAIHDTYETVTGKGHHMRLKTIMSYSDHFEPIHDALLPLVEAVGVALQRPFRGTGWKRSEPDARIIVETSAEKRDRELLQLTGFGDGDVLNLTISNDGHPIGFYKCFPSFELVDGGVTKQITTRESLVQLIDAAYRIGQADEGCFTETDDDNAMLGLEMLKPKVYHGQLCTFVHMTAGHKGVVRQIGETAKFVITRTYAKEVVVDIQFYTGYLWHVKMNWGPVDAHWPPLKIDNYYDWIRGEAGPKWVAEFCEARGIMRLFEAVEVIQTSLKALRDRTHLVTQLSTSTLRGDIRRIPTRVKELAAVKVAAEKLIVSGGDKERHAVLVRGIEMAIRIWEAYMHELKSALVAR
jgi:hypothetical protein